MSTEISWQCPIYLYFKKNYELWKKNTEIFLLEFSEKKSKCKPTIKLSTKNWNTVPGPGMQSRERKKVI